MRGIFEQESDGNASHGKQMLSPERNRSETASSLSVSEVRQTRPGSRQKRVGPLRFFSVLVLLVEKPPFPSKQRSSCSNMKPDGMND